MGFKIDPGDASGIEVPLQVPNTRVGDTATVKITRPNNTTAYAALDVIGQAAALASATAGNALLQFTFPRLAPWLGAIGNSPTTGGEFMLISVEMNHEVGALVSTEANYILYLYNQPPATPLLDNAAFSLLVVDSQFHARKIAIATPTDEGAVIMTEVDNIFKQITMVNNTLWGYLVTVAGYTPVASEVYNVTIHGYIP